MNLIFKIVQDLPQHQKILVKFCRQNSQISIDDCQAWAVDYEYINFSNYEDFVHSILRQGILTITNQLENEVGTEKNYEVEITNSTSIENNLNKIISMDYKRVIYRNENPVKFLNKVDI